MDVTLENLWLTKEDEVRGKGVKKVSEIVDIPLEAFNIPC